MSYNTANLSLITLGELTGSGRRLWVYSDTATDATVYAAGYISDALAKGMKVNDIVFYIKTDTNNLFIHTVLAVASTGATLSSTSVPDAH